MILGTIDRGRDVGCRRLFWRVTMLRNKVRVQSLSFCFDERGKFFIGELRRGGKRVEHGLAHGQQ